MLILWENARYHPVSEKALTRIGNFVISILNTQLQGYKKTGFEICSIKARTSTQLSSFMAYKQQITLLKFSLTQTLRNATVALTLICNSLILVRNLLYKETNVVVIADE